MREDLKSRGKKERRVPALPLRFSKRTTPPLLLNFAELGSPQVDVHRDSVLRSIPETP